MVDKPRFAKHLNKAEKAIDYLDPDTGTHLVPKYETFCLEYVNTFDSNKALRAAGYPVDSRAKSTVDTAFRNVMHREDVRLRIQALIREKGAHVGVGPDWIVMKWMEMVSRCMQAEAVLDKEGEPTGEWKFDSRGAGAVLHDMAAHFGMFQKDKTSSKPVKITMNFGPKERPPIDAEVSVVPDE